MIRSTSAASVLIACVLTTSADARSETLALAGGRLVDGYGGPPLDNAVVLVKGSRIDAIGRVGAIAIPSGARVIDALVHNSDRGRELAWPRLPSSDHLAIRHPERRHGVENLAPDPSSHTSAECI